MLHSNAYQTTLHTLSFLSQPCTILHSFELIVISDALKKIVPTLWILTDNRLFFLHAFYVSYRADCDASNTSPKSVVRPEHEVRDVCDEFSTRATEVMISPI